MSKSMLWILVGTLLLLSCNRKNCSSKAAHESEETVCVEEEKPEPRHHSRW